MKKKYYKLKIRCGNCKKKVNIIIPFGYDFREFDNFMDEPAGYGKPCWNGRHFDCSETVSFHKVKCDNCGSEEMYTYEN